MNATTNTADQTHGIALAELFDDEPRELTPAEVADSRAYLATWKQAHGLAETCAA